MSRFNKVLFFCLLIDIFTYFTNFETEGIRGIQTKHLGCMFVLNLNID